MKNDIRINDEPVLNDTIGHYQLVEYIVGTLVTCDPPYVIGISGSWGAGKTSFLRKVWGVMGGEFAVEKKKKHLSCCQEMLPNYTELQQKWVEKHNKNVTERKNQLNPPSSERHGFEKWRVVWFNPWQHQFENNPLIALLHEIRAQFSLMQKTKQEVEKMGQVSAYAVLDTLCNAVKTLSLGLVPKLDLDKIQKKGEDYENRHYDTALTSQTFCDYFEHAVELIVGKNGRLLICIDDLDRCEGELAFRLLESLKLYLNVPNCIFIIGMDQNHLEKNLSHLSKHESEDNPRDAREYLDKMLQDRFVLPVPSDMKHYLRDLLRSRNIPKKHSSIFIGQDIEENLITILNDNLPHNPRKIKLFLANWTRYLDLISHQLEAGLINWQLTIILTYLAVYEEPIYRSIELSPEKYRNELLQFVTPSPNSNQSIAESRHYKDLELPPGLAVSGREDSGLTSNNDQSSQPQQSRYIFWIARLVSQIESEITDAKVIKNHLIDSRIATDSVQTSE